MQKSVFTLRQTTGQGHKDDLIQSLINFIAVQHEAQRGRRLWRPVSPAPFLRVPCSSNRAQILKSWVSRAKSWLQELPPVFTPNEARHSWLPSTQFTTRSYFSSTKSGTQYGRDASKDAKQDSAGGILQAPLGH